MDYPPVLFRKMLPQLRVLHIKRLLNVSEKSKLQCISALQCCENLVSLSLSHNTASTQLKSNFEPFFYVVISET